MSRYTRAIIDLSAIKENFRQLQPGGGCTAIAVVKADAYGHGSISVAKALAGECKCYAVAICEEAAPLRLAGIKQPVLILEGPHEASECEMAWRENLILLIHNQQQISWLETLDKNQRPTVWLKVDTGMHRLGFQSDEVTDLVAKHPWLLEKGVLVSHFACADDPENAFNQLQLRRLNGLREILNLPVCFANSAAALTIPASHCDWCRLGIGLYGASPVTGHQIDEYQLHAAMTLQSQIIALHNVPEGESVGYAQGWTAQRDSVIATVGIGYADGYPRHCKSGTPIIVRGQRASLVGRVSMDMITVDVTNIPGVALQDIVELWGKKLPVDEVASYAGTISYELITRVSSRVPRIYAPTNPENA